MTAIAPTLQAFFTDRLINQRHASPKTIASYRDAWRLLVGFAAGRSGKQPCALDFDDIDTTLVAAFLDHLENGPRQQRADPQRSPRSAAFNVPLRRPPAPRASRDNRPGPGHATQTL
jgi:hypothetical protein